MLGCYGDGKADKLAEICGGVVLAGEISLVEPRCCTATGSASHDQLGRNRP